MDRRQLKSMGVAAPGYGNARFLDEGDEVEPDAVVFTRSDGTATGLTSTVFATDAAGAPVEATRRTFADDSAAHDYMFQCLRESVAARRSATVAAAEVTENQAALSRPTLVESYRRLGVSGVATTLAGIATALGWLWISPFVYTVDDTFKLYASGSDRGSYIFDADYGLVVVAVCYLVATVNVVDQWLSGRGRALRRRLGTCLGTAFFAALALACMAIRHDEITNPLAWAPPVLALLSGLVASVALFARRAATEPFTSRDR